MSPQELATNLDFLSGVLKTLTGAKIVAKGKAGVGDGGPFDLDCLHKRSLQWGGETDPLVTLATAQSLPAGTPRIYVKTLSGMTQEYSFKSSETVGELKKRIAQIDGTPANRQRLLFAGKQMEDDRALADHNIQAGSTIHLVRRVGDGSVYTLEPGFLDPPYNCDFTHVTDAGQNFKRGEKTYQRPCGWMRVALKVADKYESGVWLGGISGGIRTGSVDGEWPVSYHGTEKEFAEKIVGNQFKDVRGVLSTPDPKVAEKYAEIYNFQGDLYKVIIQNRINMEDTFHVEGSGKNYFITKNEKNIRPYGILFKKI